MVLKMIYEDIVFPVCSSCHNVLEIGDDNWLGLDPYYCKHWCNECFIKIEKWRERKNEEKKREEEEKERRKIIEQEIEKRNKKILDLRIKNKILDNFVK